MAYLGNTLAAVNRTHVGVALVICLTDNEKNMKAYL